MKKLAILALLMTSACLAPATSGLDADGEPIPLAIYAVSGANIQDGVDPEHLDQWVRFNTLIPARYRPEIVQFQAIDSVATGGIDGTVAPLNDARSQWMLMLDTTGAVELPELDRTMVHEYAHLMTLRLSQVPNGNSNCDTTLSISEGCPTANSYLAAYTNAFYADQRDGEAELNYSADAFVTEYAATNVVEDIAESFAEWVVHPERWQGDSVADRKVQFFARYSELVSLKADIRDDL